MLRDTTRRLGWLLAVCLGVCVLAEGVARVLGAPQPATAIFRFDRELGYTYVADQTVEFAVARELYRVEFDRDGVLDRAGPRPETIVILGDGVVAGLELRREERLATLVATGRTGVVNLAVPGYGPLQEVLRLERWLAAHARPRAVIVVHNFGNDLIDSVPEWEGTAAIPSLRKRGPLEFEVIPPVLPGGAYRWLSGVAKHSRLYGASERLRSQIRRDGLAPQQRWLYADVPPPELDRGLDALRWSGRRLRKLAEEHRFSVVVISWVDWPLLWRAVDAPLEHQRLASARAQKATGFASSPIPALIPDQARDVAEWEGRWMIEVNRHANAAAISVVSRAIVEALKAINE